MLSRLAFSRSLNSPSFFIRHLASAAQPAVAKPAAVQEQSGEGELWDPSIKIIRRNEDLPPPPKEGPERDLVNYPRRCRPITGSPMRHLFLPESWFTFFYSKTGYTGPYMFGFCTLTFMMSKEYIVMEHEFWTGVTLIIVAYAATKNLGPSMRKYMRRELDEDEYMLKKWKATEIKNLTDVIDHEKKEQWRAEGQNLVVAAKKENIGLQLEAAYRQRIQSVYKEVKNRLDYQVELLNAKRRLEQKHMVDWIIGSVMKGITPQQEKDALQKCIQDLKAIAAKSH